MLRTRVSLVLQQLFPKQYCGYCRVVKAATWTWSDVTASYFADCTGTHTYILPVGLTLPKLHPSFTPNQQHLSTYRSDTSPTSRSLLNEYGSHYEKTMNNDRFRDTLKSCALRLMSSISACRRLKSYVQNHTMSFYALEWVRLRHHGSRR